MARTQTMVQLSDELITQLDYEAAKSGVSRSALIRDALLGFLAERRSASVGQKIVNGYRKTPPVSPDAWGSPSAFGDTGTNELRARLDAEESHAGHEPW